MRQLILHRNPRKYVIGMYVYFVCHASVLQLTPVHVLIHAKSYRDFFRYIGIMWLKVSFKISEEYDKLTLLASDVLDKGSLQCQHNTRLLTG